MSVEVSAVEALQPRRALMARGRIWKLRLCDADEADRNEEGRREFGETHIPQTTVCVFCDGFVEPFVNWLEEQKQLAPPALLLLPWIR